LLSIKKYYLIMDTHNEHNPDAPWNQIEVNEPEDAYCWKNLTEAYESGYAHVFSEMQKDIQKQANEILYCLESVESGLAGRMRLLIEKLK
jgi:hypothetical protein